MMNQKPKYYLGKEDEFIIENYHLARPFSSFFPGIAGVWGVPIWVFYVNRGQAISSFGIKDKDHPVMEFQPANKAYQLTSLLGFRTFIKASLKGKNILYDAFHNGASSIGFDIETRMIISSYDLKLKEINRTLGIEVDIEYFTIPNDNYGGLARKVTIKNVARKKLKIEVLDGLPQVIPYGLSNMFLKKLPRTIEAWMGVENLENKIPYLRLKVDPTDRPEIIHIKEGNFYLSFHNDELIKPIVDPEAVFGQISDFTYPKAFLDKDRFVYPDDQLTKSKTPCCISYLDFFLEAGASLNIYSLIGNMDSLEKLKANAARIAKEKYFLKKQSENKELISGITSVAFTHSSLKNFDLYCRQNFLDNVMRGGYPLCLEYGNKETYIQVYSRKHGDPERDYNKFLLEPTYFSQGNGNFRDTNQNRRSDVWFEPHIKEEGVLNFFSLIQTDGYNPLVIKPDNFIFNSDTATPDRFFGQADKKEVMERLKRPFTPGELLMFIEQREIKFLESREEFLQAVLKNSLRLPEAEHGEGFWIDHWTYCLDLLESYLGVYPENLRSILLEKNEFTFFDNYEVVKPRCEKYFLKDNRVYQLHSVTNNHAKNNLIKSRTEFPHLSRAENGQGGIYKTTLVVKMLVVVANRFSSLDPFGTGVEMEANKPNWYDALNGLPGLLGSSACETFELKRWIVFLQDSFKKIALDKGRAVSLPYELYDLLAALSRICEEGLNDYAFWDASHTLKEGYRQKTLMGFSGREKEITVRELDDILDNFLDKIDSGLKKAYDSTQKLSYAYFINEVTDYELIDNSGPLPLVKPLKFKQNPLPLFLESAVHSLRVVKNQNEAKKIFRAVRKSRLYDRKLKMYKVNAPLSGMPEEIGRCRVFTPGWLENESVWLHMEYKYILELLKNGLFKEFYADFKNVLIPFQPASRYGRSILENSSFLVSSVFPQKGLHGSGFVARLSGSTAEFIHIWLIMCAGKNPFYLNDEHKLCLEFKPVLPGWLFSQKEEDGFAKNTFAFKFLNKTLVVYHNPKRKDAFGPDAAKPKEIIVQAEDKSNISLRASCIEAPLAGDIREGRAARIDIFLG